MRGSRPSCASGSCRPPGRPGRPGRRGALALTLLLASSGCDRVDERKREGAAAPAPALDAAAASAATAAMASPTARERPARTCDAGADCGDPPIAAKSIGHTSYVLKITLADGSRGVFKPRSRRPLGDRRYRGEIAAYRLAAA